MKKKYLISITMLLSVVLYIYLVKRYNNSATTAPSKTLLSETKSKNILRLDAPLLEKKKKAVEMILLSKEIFMSNSWRNLLIYIKETNDSGELSDFKRYTGISLVEALSKLEGGELNGRPLPVLGTPILNNPKLYTYLSKEYFYNEFSGIKGSSVLDSRFDHMWKIEYSPEFKGTNYLLLIHGYGPYGNEKPGLCTFGAFHKDTGEWRALPVSAFSIE